MVQGMKSTHALMRTLPSFRRLALLYLHRLLRLIVCKLQQEGWNESCGSTHARMHGWVCTCVMNRLPRPSLINISFATVLVASWGLVTSNVSCFTLQAVVELLSLCGLFVVSGLLTQDPLKWGFFFSPHNSVSDLHAHRHQHLNISPNVDKHACLSHVGCKETWFCG